MDNGEILRAVAARKDSMIAMRRDLHRHPELAFRETRTAGIIADKLRASAFDEVQTGIGTTGVVGILKGGQPGRTLMIRADIDGLPIIEDSEVEFKSETSGAMHACGHDGHVAIGLAVADILAERRADIAGTVKVLFQPAEEIVSGAQPMIDAGVMEGPHVDGVIGIHLWNDVTAGSVGLASGPTMANVDSIRLTVRGKGGHGSQPEKSVDSVVAAAQVIMTLQTIVSREVAPADAAVLTFGTINGGFASNIIAPEVVMTGTIRSYLPAVRELVLKRVEELATGVAKALRCEIIFEVVYSCPAVVNDADMVERVRTSSSNILGQERVRPLKPVMGSDDMGLFLRAAPGCYFMVGSGKTSGEEVFPHHHPRFDIDESSLEVGATTLTKAALDFLR